MLNIVAKPKSARPNAPLALASGHAVELLDGMSAAEVIRINLQDRDRIRVVVGSSRRLTDSFLYSRSKWLVVRTTKARGVILLGLAALGYRPLDAAAG